MSTHLHEHLDTARLVIGKSTSRDHKAALGQFLTPYPIARFMASLFSKRKLSACRLVDPGTGLGALCGAFIERWKKGELSFDTLAVTAFEIDDRLRNGLKETVNEHWRDQGLSFQLVEGDFIEQAALSITGYAGDRLRFTHAILNPPYKKIASDSKYRHFLRKAGIETVNLYSGFLGLTILSMEAQGEIVAVIPRSFCNGPYYKPFRKLLIQETAIHHIHLFASRNSAFKDDDVLQENVIVFLEKNGQQRDVTISTSTDDTFADVACYNAPFSTVVQPGDTERFVHIPTTAGRSEIESSSAVSHSLSDIEVQVSTGPIVDFRLRQHLRPEPESGSVPLIYPSHFIRQRLIWPNFEQRKPNALMVDEQTQKWLYPSGFYTVVRRFSSKEESRRIVAYTVSPADVAFSQLGFENHLNVFHNRKQGLGEDLARGLATFLNSTPVDVHFRRFNGHTQVNATDLRMMRYPSRAALSSLGRWSKAHQVLTQDEIDREVRKID